MGHHEGQEDRSRSKGDCMIPLRLLIIVAIVAQWHSQTCAFSVSESLCFGTEWKGFFGSRNPRYSSKISSSRSGNKVLCYIVNQNKGMIEGSSVGGGSPNEGVAEVFRVDSTGVPSQRKPVYFQQSTVTPYQILHPNVCPTVFERPVAPKPLYRALSLIQQALVEMKAGDSKAFPDFVVRVGHPISTGSVDPLAWISAQQHKLVSLSRIPQSYFYCQNQEEDFEVAAIGAVYTCNATNQIWSFLERPDWPRRSRWYGGERFDSSLESTQQSPEWKNFAGSNSAWWILPTIELRREKNLTVLAVHVVPKNVQQTLDLLSQINDQCVEQRPSTTLPPLLSRSTSFKKSDGSMYDGQEMFEEAVGKAIEVLEASDAYDSSDDHAGNLKKVVLARVQRMRLGVTDFCALAVLRRWKYAGHEDGHLFWMQPGGVLLPTMAGTSNAEFFGCSPERLFRVKRGDDDDDDETMMVESEALAGTRPRGSTPMEDAQLLQDLVESPKDKRENEITGDFIGRAFSKMQDENWIVASRSPSVSSGISSVLRAPDYLSRSQGKNLTTISSGEGVVVPRPSLFVRRLLHLQHLCQSFKAQLSRPGQALNVTRFLLTNLHPTPAVCGAPFQSARAFIRKYESIGFDRGFYSGPVGYIGLDASDVFVALRSGLLTKGDVEGNKRDSESALFLYAGAGIVSGSTVKGEWAETTFKLNVISSVFPQSPMTLQGAQTPNVAWAAAFCEELIRNGVTQFYVCPGSRSTPLVVALSRAARSHVGVVQLTSVHDERAAAFRAVGYGRGAHRPAAVITSSGTAVANLYPAIVEAGMDGVPLLLVTADRPYENRDTGANQAIDQVKIFSSTYVRWYRDILPPSDTVPISLALSDAGHAVNVARSARGPVHLNIQFRENLAPEEGPIRNDGRIDAITRFNAFRFTDTPKFSRWSITGKTFQKELKSYDYSESSEAAAELSTLISNSRRAIIVVGNIRPSLVDVGKSQIYVADLISDFAQHVGFPIIAGVQQVALRFRSPSVILFAEHLLKCPEVGKNLNPDLVIQIGAPLVSSEIHSVISRSIKDSIHQAFHVLIHPTTVAERVDPSFTVTHNIAADYSFLQHLTRTLTGSRGSELGPLVTLGRRLQKEMKQIIHLASTEASKNHGQRSLSEPEVILALAEAYAARPHSGLFLSNSMPVRDAEFFLYPFTDVVDDCVIHTGSNRGASGIDGIISTARGFAEGTETQTTLLIGDVSALHDIGSLQKLGDQGTSLRQGSGKRHHAITTIVVNNDGGGIFSFLPIARHGKDVSFDEFFGTPTNSFSFERGAEAFSLPYERVGDYDMLLQILFNSTTDSTSTLVEAAVMNRESNVLLHRRIVQEVGSFVSNLLTSGDPEIKWPRLNTFSNDFQNLTFGDESTKTLLLLHGWMGDKSDWDEVALSLSGMIPSSWSIKTIDLAGHGESISDDWVDIISIRRSLNLQSETGDHDLNINNMADYVVGSLASHGVTRIDALVGYSLGGRIALDLYDRYASNSGLIHSETKLILLSSHVGRQNFEESSRDDARMLKDDSISDEILFRWYRSCLEHQGTVQKDLLWDDFLEQWYSSPFWSDLKHTPQYPKMKKRRSFSLQSRGPSLADVLSTCSPPRNRRSLQRFMAPGNVMLIVGANDPKYYTLGLNWHAQEGIEFETVQNSGHAVIIEKPLLVADKIAGFLSGKRRIPAASPKSVLIAQQVKPYNGFLHGDQRNAMSMRFGRFSLALKDSFGKSSSVSGIGWGENARKSSKLTFREGFILQLESRGENGAVEVGLGEVAPLKGLHLENMEIALSQIEKIKASLDTIRVEADLDASQVVQLKGYLTCWAKSRWPDMEMVPSVRAGLEMALLGLAANKLRIPIHQALLRETGDTRSSGRRAVEVSGLLTRGCTTEGDLSSLSFRSLKVKVGHQDSDDDISSIRSALRLIDSTNGPSNRKIRLDANRAWSWTEASNFYETLVKMRIREKIEFIEEPLSVNFTGGTTWSFKGQVESLEAWSHQTNLLYALDESLADLAASCGFRFDVIQKELIRVFENRSRGCAAIILKPSFLGLELSMQLARVARQELGMGAIFSSCFESGIGLSYIGFLAGASDAIKSSESHTTFGHGIGTFSLLDGDVLSPPFSSYVNDKGLLQVSPISRALYSLTLDEMLIDENTPFSTLEGESVDESGSTRDDELSTTVSLMLPFSSETAHSRFTDLPQQPRWSPWLSSVSYQGKESEWKINIRGIPFKWRARSQLLDNPWLGIQWESVSGVSNHGSVEFIPITDETCEMKLSITIAPPRILAPIFNRAKSTFLEDFIRDKIIYWSLEMFRDVVKADLAIERGDMELGDALYGTVVGKANAIEATLQGSVNGESKDY